MQRTIKLSKIMTKNYQKVEKFGRVNIKNDKNEYVLRNWCDEITELPNGLLLARDGDETTLLDGSGRELLDSPVTTIYQFFGDFALVNYGTRYGIIDRRGNYVFELQEPAGVGSWCFIGSRRNCVAVNIETGEIGDTLLSEVEEVEHGDTIEELSWIVTRTDGKKNIFDADGGFFRTTVWFEKIHVIDGTYAAGWDGEEWTTFPYVD